jgi:hypothetical protein
MILNILRLRNSVFEFQLNFKYYSAHYSGHESRVKKIELKYIQNINFTEKKFKCKKSITT